MGNNDKKCPHMVIIDNLGGEEYFWSAMGRICMLELADIEV
jgi:hypothetical protein